MTINKSEVSQDDLSFLKQYQHMVDETNIVTKTDPKGIITYANRKFIDISGYSEDELIGQPHNIVRNPELPSSLFKKLWKTIQSKEAWHGIVTNLRKDGTTYTVKASIFPILDSNGEIVEYISIRHDITKITKLQNELKDINTYIIEQEQLAKNKLEAGIVNDMNESEYAVIHHSSDILSGDFYSIYKLKDGSIFLYVIDGQGHGISPALTVFAISSLLNQFIYEIDSIEELIEKFYPAAKTFLADLEQLSYTGIMISPDKKSISYSSGGMYPFLIKKGNEVIRVKANNLPFMNFSPMPTFDTIDIDGLDSLMVYSDGIVEHDVENLQEYTPQNMINNPSNIKNIMNKISQHDFDDDVTIVCLGEFN